MFRTISRWSIALLALSFGAALWVWAGQERRRTLHLDQGAEYAARVLEEIGTVPDELAESSGIAASRTQPGVLWSHNDSGDRAAVYAIESSGRLVATIRLQGAKALDWEDMAAGPCPALPARSALQAETCLYVGDIGDNDQQRDTLSVHVIPEPRLEKLAGSTLDVEAVSFRFRYPDEAHDSEALAVLPTGDVTIVSKGRIGRMDFYGLASPDIDRAIATGEILTASHEGALGIAPDPGVGRYATGAAMSPDGRTLAVRTYNEVFFFERVSTPEGTRWQNLERPCFLGYAEPQGEAIDYLDEETLILTSERGALRPGPIHRLQC